MVQHITGLEIMVLMAVISVLTPQEPVPFILEVMSRLYPKEFAF